MSDTLEALIAASETATWERHALSLPVSYRSRYVRQAHRDGFAAGLKFAQMALSLPIEPTEPSCCDAPGGLERCGDCPLDRATMPTEPAEE